MTGVVSIRQIYYPRRMEANETVLVERLQKRDEAVFEHVFKSNFRSLHLYAFTMLKDEAAAEEMVQNVFYKLWERAHNLSIAGSIRAYLYRAVHNESLNYLKHVKVRTQHHGHISRSMDQSPEAASKKIHLTELEEHLHQALNELPEQCRTIFQLSRFGGLRYKEIADRLEISAKTVENQMGKALRLLRLKLVEFLPIILLLLDLNHKF